MKPERLLEGLRRLAAVEREAVAELVHAGILDDEVGGELTDRIDARLDALDEAAADGEDALVTALDELLSRPDEAAS